VNTEGAKREREHIRGDLPPQILASVDEIVYGLIAKLGESPEAWWGASSALMDIVSKPIVLAVAEGRSTGEDKSVMTLIMLVLGQFLSHPISMANIQLARELRKEANDGAQAAQQAEQ